MTPNIHRPAESGTLRETFAGLALKTLLKGGDRPALVSDERTLSGLDAVSRVARMQRVLGGSRPPRLALLSRNKPDAWLLQIAAMALGGIVVWLHPRASLSDSVFVIADSKADALAIDADVDLELVEALAHGFHGPVFRLSKHGPGTHLADVLEGMASAEVVDRSEPDDLALLNYTGGTTGKPKAVVRTQADWALIAKRIVEDYEIECRSRYLVAGPISHVSGTKILPTLMCGGTAFALADAPPPAVASAIERWRITSTLLVPTALSTLAEEQAARPRDLSSLTKLFYGGASIATDQLRRAVEVFGPVLYQVYGQTECYPLCRLKPADLDPDLPHRWRSCGAPVPSIKVRLVDASGDDVAQGRVGELIASGEQVMHGYWNRPAETAAAMQGHWLHTGDLAFAHSDGFIEIVGRTKDMIISGGFNIYAREVEVALEAHPAVAVAAVYGLPDAKWGEAVTASVVLRSENFATADELTAWVRQLKGSFQAPKRLEFIESMPMTSVGKIDKKALRQRWSLP